MRRALVTGGNRGIGLAVAKSLVAEGLEVVIAAHRLAEAEAAVAQAGAARAVVLDLEIERTHAPAITAAGPLDVLVNNAGILEHGSLLDSAGDYDRAMQVMARGPLQLIRLVVPGMAERGYGRIVNMSSGWGSHAEGLEGPGAYGVAKAALNAITHALPRDLPAGILVNAACPGWVRTRMGEQGADRSPEEGADTAVWLATLGADGPTGGFYRDRAPIPW